MCEFKVIVKGEIAFEDAVYAKAEENSVIIKDILGETRKFENSRIVEVDVNNVRLVLSSTE